MFWGLVLEPSKKYTQKVDQTFHISQAALDLKSCDANEFVQLVVEYENSSFVLATLSKKANIFQVPLDLIFRTGDQVSFRTIGNGKVHLSGYHVLEDLDSMIMNGEEESDLDELPFPAEKGKGKRKKLSLNARGGKKAKLENSNEDGTDDDEEEEDDEDDDDFDEEDSEDDEEKTAGKKTKKKKPSLKENLAIARMVDEDDDDDDDEEDDDLDEEDLDDDEDIEMDEEDDDENLDMFDTDEEEKKVKVKSPKSEGKKSPQTPNGVAKGLKGKDKAAQKGNKGMQQETPGKEKKAPKNEVKQKNDKSVKPGSAESTPKSKKEDKNQKSPKSESSPQKRVLEGGLISEELKVGNGPVAKPGKMVTVYYVGTLATGKKPFDSVQSGSGFKFRVGRNEVIKGWDIGVAGMKVGGKRRLTIPPHLGYGSKGSLPVIPPNSTLVFTVELKAVS